MIWERRATVASNPVVKRYMREQWRRMQRVERAQCLRFDHVVAVSAEDAAVFRERYGVERVSSVPTGVDTEFFRPSGAVSRRPGSIVFTGSMDWMPNEDGMAFFVEDVLPLVRRAEQIGQRAASHVRAHFGWAAVAEQFADRCVAAASRRDRSSPVMSMSS